MKIAIVLLSTSALACATSSGGGSAPAAPAPASAAPFGDWPPGASPAEVGRRVIENLLARPLPATGAISYQEACAWYGALATAQLIQDADLGARLVARFAPVLTPAGAATLIPQRAHVDDRVFGIVPFEIYLRTHDDRTLAIGRDLADKQWATTTADGITTEARYWVDDMYMITSLQLQAFRATGDVRYLDRAALAMTAYLDKLQQPNGLFFHTAESPEYWGRGNGWFAAGMAELLRTLPPEHPRRARILDGYRKMMAALLAHQTPAGLWLQLIDLNDDPRNWPETSSSGMFAFAMVTGVKNGWLPETPYGPAARRAWLALVGKLDAQANLTEVCVGTGHAAAPVGPERAAQLDYYFRRERHAGDFHGQAPVLWTASALLR